MFYEAFDFEDFMETHLLMGVDTLTQRAALPKLHS